MKDTRKSLHRSKNGKLWKKRANQRAAKERHRIARADFAASPEYAEQLIAGNTPQPKRKHSEFRVTIEFLDDGERVQFTSFNGPHGLTVSPTLAGKKVSAILSFYKPA